MSGSHKEIRNEGEEGGVEAVDRRQAGQQGKRHACIEKKNMSRHFNNTKTSEKPSLLISVRIMFNIQPVMQLNAILVREEEREPDPGGPGWCPR